MSVSAAKLAGFFASGRKPRVRSVPESPIALDLFCGAGGATKGLQRAGFRVVGVDIKPQSRYCGEQFINTDALGPDMTYEFLHSFDFIWASPPCQAFTALRHLPSAKDHPNRIPETRARLISARVPYCIENVEGAPLGDSGFLIMLCGSMFGLQTADGRAVLQRHRLFETSFSIPLRPACQHGTVSIGVPRISRARAITVTGSTPQTNTVRNLQREVFTTQQAREAMGIDWMPMSALSQAIPPAYSEFIGRQAMEYIRR